MEKMPIQRTVETISDLEIGLQVDASGAGLTGEVVEVNVEEGLVFIIWEQTKSKAPDEFPFKNVQNFSFFEA